MQFVVTGAHRQTGDAVHIKIEARNAPDAIERANQMDILVEDAVPFATVPPPQVIVTEHVQPPIAAERSDVQVRHDEQVIFDVHPSHWRLRWFYFWCVLFCWLIVPLMMAIYQGIRWHSFRYTLTNQRLRLKRGILLRVTDDIELYRVKDTVMDILILDRVFGIGDMTMMTSDKSHPRIVLRGVPNILRFREAMRENVETMRRIYRAREVDID